jgi:hypothetical protein
LQTYWWFPPQNKLQNKIEELWKKTVYSSTLFENSYLVYFEQISKNTEVAQIFSLLFPQSIMYIILKK